MTDEEMKLEKARALARAEELARPKLWDGGHWTADYRRLRAVARKPVK